jgi:hypothetical protein
VVDEWEPSWWVAVPLAFAVSFVYAYSGAEAWVLQQFKRAFRWLFRRGRTSDPTTDGS